MELLVFIAATLMVLAGAIGVIVRDNPVHCALSLVLTLFGVAVHFVAQQAHFLAAVQVIVYAGAIVVLFLFVIMLLGVDRSEDLRVDPLPIQRPLAAIVGLATAGLLVAGILAARNEGALTTGSGVEVASDQASHDSNIEQLGESLFSTHVFAFEFTGVLLVVAVAATVVLTRRERRPKETREDAE